jgi:FtsH-binding integral membrane protein
MDAISVHTTYSVMGLGLIISAVGEVVARSADVTVPRMGPMGMVHGLDDLLCGYAMPMLKLGEQLLDGFKSGE